MTHPTTVDNPFNSKQAVAPANAVAQADSERAIQEVQAAMVAAKRFPRDPLQAMERIINACTRESLADSALYSYKRGGMEVTGPSIRLAETIAQNWGNIQCGVRELSSANGVSTVEAFAWDLESNTRDVKVFQVEHVRDTKQGQKKLTDRRDIYELIANLGARRKRACILAVVPGDVTEAAQRQCEVTQANSVQVTPESIKAMVAAFEEHYGVDKQLIEKRIGKRVDAINPAQMLNLKKIYQSLKDAMTKPSDWFDMPVGEALAEPKVSDLTAPAEPPAARNATEGTTTTEENPAFSTLKGKLLATETVQDARALRNDKLISKLSSAEIKRFDEMTQNHINAIEAMK